MSSRIYIMSEFCRHTPSVKSPRTELSYTRSSVSLISSRHACGQASPALGVVPILTVGWSSVGPHHAPSRAGPAEFLVWFGGSFQHAVALTRQHVLLTPAAVTLPSAEAIAVARSAAYMYAQRA